MMDKKILIIIQLIMINISFSWGGQSLLTNECNIETIPQILVEGHSWVDFPKYEDRKFWDNISLEIKLKIVEQGVIASQTPPVVLTGYDYLIFKQGDAFDLVSQKILSKKTRLEDLMLAEIVEGKGRFIKEISNSVWDFCAMSNWTGPESQYLQTGKIGLPSCDKVVVDELTGEIAGVLSWAYYFFENEFNKIDPSITNWIVSSVRSKFLTPNLQKYDFFWMCYQTKDVAFQTSWISYNWLLSNLLIEKNNDQRKKSVYKALECLDQFYKQMPGDGVCLGGAEIWQYSTGKYFQSLELLEMASVGEIDIYADSLLKKMGEFICKTHIDDNYYFNYSECSPKLTLPPSLMYRFGKKVGSNLMQGFSSYIAKEIKDENVPLTGDLFNKLKFVLAYDEIMSFEVKEPLLADCYLKESQIVIARSKQDSKEGFFFGVKGGFNNVYGKQNDAGNFILYTNGKPLIIDPGEVNKTAKSINNDDHFPIWANQSAWHNLPTVNGRMENTGANYRATGFQYNTNENEVTVSMNLAYAYELSAGVDDWTRTFTFNRKKGLEISDHFVLSKIEGDTYISFIALSKPQIKRQGVVTFSVEENEYEFDFRSDIFSIEINEIDSESDTQLKEWGSNLYRIILKPNSKEKTGTWNYSFRKV
jgi:hypothetical protein